jgi:predicted RNA-binding protein (virulence factor B family)
VKSLDDILGRSVTLPIVRFARPGAFLAIDPQDQRADAPALLLIGSEIPEGAREGDKLEVFVHLDSEGRAIATTRVPRIALGEVAFLTVTSLTNFGAFVDWGLAKELLVPFAEQTTNMRTGERYAIGVYRDKSGRLAGTMRVAEMLKETPNFEIDTWVQGEAWRNDPDIGLFVILEKKFVGLLPATEPHTLKRGEAARFRVTHVTADHKLELSLRGFAHEEIPKDAQKILDVLAKPGAPKVGDASTPEEISRAFGLSKKAFKRAIGRLLKNRQVKFSDEGYVIIVRP